MKAVPECFPKDSPWAKYFNPHTIKVSYSCTKNLATRIAQHNAKVLSKVKPSRKAGCNCTNKPDCPIPGDCKAKNVVYGAIVEADGEKPSCYFGLCGQGKDGERTFKHRYYSHMADFRNEACRKKRRDEDGANKKGTALSEKVWELKDKGKVPRITWKVVDRAYPYQAGAKTCDLCRAEKLHIALGKKGFTTLPENCVMLNKRSEIMNKCPHKRQFTLAMAKPI